jgi:hypothetical protein
LSLAFALGVLARVLKSELSIPKDLYASLALYLLFALGLRGGVELSEAHLSAIAVPAATTVLLGVITPVIAFVVLRRLGRFSLSDSAGIAAHYGSVSAVTFIAAQQFVAAAGAPAEGFMATLLALLESPGIHVGLALGGGGGSPFGDVSRTLRELLTSRTMILLVGGLVIGCLTGKHGYEPVRPFFEGGFKGALTIFLLEMGLTAGSRLGDLRKVGPFLLAFGVLLPLVHGALGVALGRLAGLSVGGSTVLGAMAASASYIAAPPAVRMNLPDANPTYSLTAALVVTFPFNLVAGIPVYFQIARLLS